MQGEYVRTQGRSSGQRQRISVGSHAESHPVPGNEIAAVTIGSDTANLDAAVSVARSGNDLTSKPNDLGRMHLRIHPQGNGWRLPHALYNRHATRRYG
jgi:hypothetical protein